MRGCATALMMLLGLFFSPTAESEQRQQRVPLRVGGNYTVSSITPQNDRSFRIRFKAVSESGKFDTLILDADHVNVGVKPGQTIRLSAEVLGNEIAEEVAVTQVLLYLPHPQGQVPVWMMSKAGQGRDLNAAKYIEMHAPTTDYLLF